VLCEPDRHGEVVGWGQKGGRKTFKGRVTSSHRTHRAPTAETSPFIKHHVGFSNCMGIIRGERSMATLANPTRNRQVYDHSEDCNLPDLAAVEDWLMLDGTSSQQHSPL
jgi:hypothetical protein